MESQPKIIRDIIIVEDEPLVAIDIEQALTEFGFNIAGVAFSLETALELVASERFDAVILDVNLKGMSAAPVADALAARGLPFIVTTGYGIDQRPTTCGFPGRALSAQALSARRTGPRARADPDAVRAAPAACALPC